MPNIMSLSFKNGVPRSLVKLFTEHQVALYEEKGCLEDNYYCFNYYYFNYHRFPSFLTLGLNSTLHVNVINLIQHIAWSAGHILSTLNNLFT